MDEEILLAGLWAAVGRRLLVVLPDADDYEVRHALLRQVVVADLLPGERARLHARFAEALAQRPELAAASPAVAAAELAAHWDAAGEPTRAFPARVAAGQAAADMHAFAEAAGHYQRALELWAEPPIGRTGAVDQVDLLGRAAEAAALSGDTSHAIGLLEQALGQLVRAAEPVRAAVMLGRLGFHCFRAGAEADALAAYQEAERLLTGAPPSAERAGVLAGHGLVLMLARRTEEAIPVCEEAIAVGARAEEADALDTLACCLGDLGDLDQSLRLHLEARRLAEAAGADETMLRTYLNRIVSLELAGRGREGIDDAREGLQRARRLGLERAWGSLVAGNLAWGLLQAGRWAECDRLTEELLAGDSWGAFLLHTARAALLTRQGDFPAARVQLDRSLALSPATLGSDAWLSLAELALWEGRHDDAKAAVAEGMRWCAQRDPDGGSRSTLPPGLRAPKQKRRSLAPGIGRISAVAFSPDGKNLAVGGERSAPVLVDVASGRVTAKMAGGHDGGIRAVRFDPKGLRLVTAGGDRKAIVWDAGSGGRLFELRQPGDDDFNDTSAAWSPDGSLLATAGGAGKIVLWRVSDRQQVATLPADPLWATSVAFSPDGSLIAAGGLADKQVTLWEVATGKLVSRLPHPTIVVEVTFAPHGKALATSAADGTVRLWEAPSLRQIGLALPGPERWSVLGFDPGGNRLAALYDNGTALVWDVNPEHWKKRACAVVGRPLTREEWEELLPRRSYQPACQ